MEHRRTPPTCVGDLVTVSGYIDGEPDNDGYLPVYVVDGADDGITIKVDPEDVVEWWPDLYQNGARVIDEDEPDYTAGDKISFDGYIVGDRDDEFFPIELPYGRYDRRIFAIHRHLLLDHAWTCQCDSCWRENPYSPEGSVYEADEEAAPLSLPTTDGQSAIELPRPAGPDSAPAPG